MKHYFSGILLLSAVVGSVQGAEEGFLALEQSDSQKMSELMTVEEISPRFRTSLLASLCPRDTEAAIVGYRKVSCDVSTQTENSEIKKLVFTNGEIGKHFEQASSEVSEKQEVLTEQASQVQETADPKLYGL
ncbi:hypothetical protein K9K77_02430, partial [Candidatus Babeliales bacterium]|nr:hypothetical protein [Candidatus Babeliales bacterium]